MTATQPDFLAARPTGPRTYVSMRRITEHCWPGANGECTDMSRRRILDRLTEAAPR